MKPSAADIEREVEATRAHLALTAEAIRQKLTPGHIAESVMNSPQAQQAQAAAKKFGPVLALGVVAFVALQVLGGNPRQRHPRPYGKGPRTTGEGVRYLTSWR